MRYTVLLKLTLKTQLYVLFSQYIYIKRITDLASYSKKPDRKWPSFDEVLEGQQGK